MQMTTLFLSIRSLFYCTFMVQTVLYKYIKCKEIFTVEWRRYSHAILCIFPKVYKVVVSELFFFN